ncbi:MAG TPA: tRNA (adenosine(37)-N6)-dimethylallyltransferase MiaA [Actinomycetota bacterium]|nr:tRNA (adenosine(37)-N6)-dimethylallyltransferase MiaA [Actinomycetota bacterium]
MKLLAIVGPTAVGKTRMAVEVAQRLDASIEIVSCDSVAVYRGLDIVADKPSAIERSSVPHHLVDVAHSSAEFTVVEYRTLAREAIADITARGAVPMLVGGSGLYFRGVVDDLSFAPTSAEVRRRLERQDPAELFARLAEADPASAERLDPRNVRRVVRAVEILELTGRPPSELRGEWERAESPYELTAVGLTRPREELDARVAERVIRQLEAGLVDEVREATLSKTSEQAIGVKEILPFIRGDASLEQARAEFVRNAKAFVRRQLSWFRSDPRIAWIDVTQTGWDEAREQVVERFES